MLSYIFLILSIVLSVCKSGIYNKFAKSENPGIIEILLFNALSYGTVTALTLLLGGFGKISLITLVCAAAYAIDVFSLQAISIAAMKIGPMSLTTMFVLYGMIIPSLSGPVFWGEPFGAAQAVGIALILLSVWLLCEPDGARNAIGRKWIAMAAICLLLSGMAGLIEKVHQMSAARNERISFIFTAGVIMFILSLAGKLLLIRRAKAGISHKGIVLGLVLGVIIFLYSRINLTLAGTLNSLIYYPVSNGGALILSVFVSAAIFREKLSVRKIFGAIIGLFAVVMLSII